MNSISQRRRGLTLIEIMLAIVVLTAVAVATLAYVQQPADRVKGEACKLRSQQLQVLVGQYQADYGGLPSSNLSQLTSSRYLGAPLPVCPIDGRAYLLDNQTGSLVPHDH